MTSKRKTVRVPISLKNEVGRVFARGAALVDRDSWESASDAEKQTLLSEALDDLKRQHVESLNGTYEPPKLRPKATKPSKRLLQRRMYVLKNGQYFWCFGKWDNHGTLIGKVIDEKHDCLQNMMIKRAELEAAKLVPKGEEPWVPSRH